MLSAIGLLGAAEVVSAGATFGLDPSVLVDVLNASTGRNNSTENKFAQFIFTGSFDSGFSMQLMVKDLATAVELGEQGGLESPLLSTCLEQWQEAYAALGRGVDHTAVAEFVDRRNGTHVVGSDR
jgi:3-hydroxyisobutyrate dehydrogenase